MRLHSEYLLTLSYSLWTEKELRIELKAEIDRAKALQSRVAATANGPGGIKRAGAQDSVGLKHSATVNLYEALTNLLVINVEYPIDEATGLETTLYHCVFTEQDKSTCFSLPFFLLL